MKRQQMIGLYAQNSQTQKELCRLLQEKGVESYNSTHAYKSVIWLSSEPSPKNIPIFTIKDLSLPCSLNEWFAFIQQSSISTLYYQNNTFSFNASLRLLTNLKTNEQISLTEKENNLLIFLCQAPNHTATRETLLQSVWQYNPEAQTHTLESHLYGLKQKLNKHFSKLIQIQKETIHLI